MGCTQVYKGNNFMFGTAQRKSSQIEFKQVFLSMLIVKPFLRIDATYKSPKGELWVTLR